MESSTEFARGQQLTVLAKSSGKPNFCDVVYEFTNDDGKLQCRSVRTGKWMSVNAESVVLP